MDDFTAAFAGLPGFNPFMGVNLSGTCATTKLIQWYVHHIGKKLIRPAHDQNLVTLAPCLELACAMSPENS